MASRARSGIRRRSGRSRIEQGCSRRSSVPVVEGTIVNGDGKRPNRGQLLDAAFRTAVDHIDHHKYGSEADALKSLRRRCRGFTPTQYRNALRKATDPLRSVEEGIAPFDPPYDVGSAEGGWSGFADAA